MHALRPALTVVLACAGVLQAHAQLRVVNGATSAGLFPVCPGAYAQVYPTSGTFGPVPNTVFESLPLPTQLRGMQVVIDGRPAPLYAVGSSFAAFVVPLETPVGRQIIEVRIAGSTAASGFVNVFPVSPGIFHVYEDPYKQGGILNQQGQYAVQGAPARRGEVIQVFATGQGADLDGSVPNGAVPPAGTLVRTRKKPRAFIGADEASVEFSGLQPSYPGLWQVNIRVPDKPYIKGQVTLFVEMDGVTSNAVSFWVAQ